MHDVYVAIRILRRDLLHVLLENFVTKRPNKIVQLLLEHKGIFSFLRVWNKENRFSFQTVFVSPSFQLLLELIITFLSLPHTVQVIDWRQIHFKCLLACILNEMYNELIISN